MPCAVLKLSKTNNKNNFDMKMKSHTVQKIHCFIFRE